MSANNTLLRKLLPVFAIAIGGSVITSAVRTYQHVNVMNEYTIPDSAVTSDMNEDTLADVPETDIENTVDEAAVENTASEPVEAPVEPEPSGTYYNPSEAGNALADAQNNHVSGTTDVPMVWYAGNGNYTWEFKSGFDYPSPIIDCVWTCTDGNGKLYSYLTATYNAETGTFSDGVLTMTYEGAGNSAAD